jgi:hypothetical protein
MKGRPLGFSRLRLLFMTFFDLALVALSSVGIQSSSPLAVVFASLLLAVSVAALLLLCREWFSPSFIELDKDRISLKWNNWRLSGRRLRAEMGRGLELEVGQPIFALDPVGPLHLAAMLAVMPLFFIFLPPYLARLYFLNSGELSKLLCPDGGPAAIRFPAWIFGKRRIRNALEKNLE